MSVPEGHTFRKIKEGAWAGRYTCSCPGDVNMENLQSAVGHHRMELMRQGMDPGLIPSGEQVHASHLRAEIKDELEDLVRAAERKTLLSIAERLEAHSVAMTADIDAAMRNPDKYDEAVELMAIQQGVDEAAQEVFEEMNDRGFIRE